MEQDAYDADAGSAASKYDAIEADESPTALAVGGEDEELRAAVEEEDENERRRRARVEAEDAENLLADALFTAQIEDEERHAAARAAAEDARFRIVREPDDEEAVARDASQEELDKAANDRRMRKTLPRIRKSKADFAALVHADAQANWDKYSFHIRMKALLLVRYRSILDALEKEEFRARPLTSAQSFFEDDSADSAMSSDDDELSSQQRAAMLLRCTSSSPIHEAAEKAAAAADDAAIFALSICRQMKHGFATATHTATEEDGAASAASAPTAAAQAHRDALKKVVTPLKQLELRRENRVQRASELLSSRACSRRGRIMLSTTQQHLCSPCYIDQRATARGLVYGKTTCSVCADIFGRGVGEKLPKSFNPILCSPCYTGQLAVKHGIIDGETLCSVCEDVFGRGVGEKLPAAFNPHLCSPCFSDQRTAALRIGLTIDDVCSCGKVFKYHHIHDEMNRIRFAAIAYGDRVCTTCYDAWKSVDRDIPCSASACPNTCRLGTGSMAYGRGESGTTALCFSCFAKQKPWRCFCGKRFLSADAAQHIMKTHVDILDAYKVEMSDAGIPIRRFWVGPFVQHVVRRERSAVAKAVFDAIVPTAHLPPVTELIGLRIVVEYTGEDGFYRGTIVRCDSVRSTMTVKWTTLWDGTDGDTESFDTTSLKTCGGFVDSARIELVGEVGRG